MREGPIALCQSDGLVPLLRRLFVLLIKGREHEILSANPHSIWDVATSWAEIARVPASEIRRAATWSGPCTFAQFYRLDFSAGGFGGAILETAALAGSA